MSTVIFIVALGFFVGAFFAFRGGANRIKRASAWPTTTGTVTASEVVRMRTTEHDQGSYRRTRTRVTESANIVYNYSVDGVQHTSDKIRFGPVNGEAAARAMVAKYPVGATPAVHYNPEKPDQAVLELTSSGGGCLGWALVGFGVFIGLMGLMIHSVETAFKNAPPPAYAASSTPAAPATSDAAAEPATTAGTAAEAEAH